MGTLAPLTLGLPSLGALVLPSPVGSASPPAPGPCPWPGSGCLSRAQGVTRGRGVVPPPPAAPHSGSGPAGTPIPHTSLSSQPLQGEHPAHLPCSLAVSTRPRSWPNGTLQAPTCAHHAGLGSRVGGANLILAPHPTPVHRTASSACRAPPSGIWAGLPLWSRPRRVASPAPLGGEGSQLPHPALNRPRLGQGGGPPGGQRPKNQHQVWSWPWCPGQHPPVPPPPPGVCSTGPGAGVPLPFRPWRGGAAVGQAWA